MARLLHTTDLTNGCCAMRPPAPPAADDWTARGRSWRGPLPTFPTKKARLAFLRAALGAKPAWAYRALTLVFERQTAQEQAAGVTIARNGVGFSGVDAEILTSLATQYLAKQAALGGGRVWLSPRQEALLLRKMPKYASQLVALLEARGALPLVGTAARKAVA